MTPYKYTVKDGVTHFHYKYSELKHFLEVGFKSGDTGWILVRREGDYIVYKGFGTIENPTKSMFTISCKHCDAFDGEMCTDEERLIPPKPFLDSGLVSCRFEILDFSKGSSD